MNTQCLIVMMALLVVAPIASAAEANFVSVPEPTPLPERVAPYSMVCYGLSDDEDYMRGYIGSLRDLGCTQALTLIYWWQHEPLDGDWWKGRYAADSFGDTYLRRLDLFVELCREMGIRPAFRLGSFREWKGLWHPADESRDIAPYAEWVGRIATRYRGRIDHYIVGDEENKALPAADYDGSAAQYLERFLIPIALAIRAADPAALISSCGTSSSPATEWNLELIRLGLPRYADGIACNIWHRLLEEPASIERLTREARQLWPNVKFFSNGMVYAERDGLHDAVQAARVAQSMFTLWELGWNGAPCYLYRFSHTADTKQDFGLAGAPRGNQPAQYTDAWYAYQTIAQTFYNRDELTNPGFEITLEPAQKLTAADGTTISLAPPNVFIRSYVRQGDELLIYLAYRDTRLPKTGVWNVVLDSQNWADAKRIPLLNYRQRIELDAYEKGQRLVIPNVTVSAMPSILVLRKRELAPVMQN